MDQNLNKRLVFDESSNKLNFDNARGDMSAIPTHLDRFHGIQEFANKSAASMLPLDYVNFKVASESADGAASPGRVR